MNMNHLITANQSNFRTIKVRLRSDADKLHTYKAHSDLDLSAGSTVVIQNQKALHQTHLRTEPHLWLVATQPRT